MRSAIAPDTKAQPARVSLPQRFRARGHSRATHHLPISPARCTYLQIYQCDQPPSAEPDKPRIIFAPGRDGPGEATSVSRRELGALVLDECKENPTVSSLILSLGEDLAKDPKVRAAVFKKFGLDKLPAPVCGSSKPLPSAQASQTSPPALTGAAAGKAASQADDLDVDDMEEEVSYLRDELDSQQTLNEQLIYHNEKLCDEKIQLKQSLAAAQRRLDNERQARQRLEKQLRSLALESVEVKLDAGPQADAAADVAADDVKEGADEDPDKAGEGGWDMSEIVVKALAVAAVVILMAVVRKRGVIRVAATSAAAGWAWMRAKMTRG